MEKYEIIINSIKEKIEEIYKDILFSKDILETYNNSKMEIESYLLQNKENFDLKEYELILERNYCGKVILNFNKFNEFHVIEFELTK